MELKSRCYEARAEDNLTAVVVRCGQRIPSAGGGKILSEPYHQRQETYPRLEIWMLPKTRWFHFPICLPAVGNPEDGQISNPNEN